MKKGDMSMGIIIAAAIALLILVIISVLLFDAFGTVQKGTACDDRDGAYCTDVGDDCADGSIKFPGADCATAGATCCIETDFR